MTDDIVPPPPASPSSDLPRENPMALAGLMISVLGLVLAIIVVGAFVGLAGLVISAVAYRRTVTRGLDGRGLALSGMALGIASIGLSVLGFFTLLSIVDTQDPIIRDGVATTSRNTTQPPQDDIDGIECRTSNTGQIAQATVQLTNRSSERSLYQVRVEWDTGGDEPVHDVVTTGYIQPGETDQVDVIDLSGRAIAESCAITAIERQTLPFFR